MIAIVSGRSTRGEEPAHEWGLTTAMGDHDVLILPGRSKATRPDSKAISDDVTVKI